MGGTPKYAILSHRWESGEVSYEELHTPASRKKEGYAKIRRFCDKVRSQGYEYAWIDTCCINKKDFFELTEAINSMFRWYRNSHTCVTYLSDFQLRPDQQLESNLRRSQWFRRGWTLQELIAPERVEFYDSNWRYIGNKQGLAPVISKITGISEALLGGSRDLKTYSCAQKMSWAANRRTTRPEDRAYSLLGLFGVNLPLIYDGHGDRAFKRLQEEIIKSSTDQSIFAWVQHGPSPFDYIGPRIFDERCSVLAPSPDCFQFSSHIVPHRSTINDTPYSLNNIGLEITRKVRKVISSKDLVLLEVLLSCYFEGTDCQVSIIVVGEKSFYKSVIRTPTENNPKDNSRLPVTRVDPLFLGPVELESGAMSTDQHEYEIPLLIQPISVDDDQICASTDDSWLEEPEWEVETRRDMKLARKRVEDLHVKREKDRKERRKELRKEVTKNLGMFIVGAFALKNFVDVVQEIKR